MAHTKYMHMFFGEKPNAKLGDIIVEHQKSTIQVDNAKEASRFSSVEMAFLSDQSPLQQAEIFLNAGGNADVKFYIEDSAYSIDTWCITAKSGMADYLCLFLNSIRS